MSQKSKERIVCNGAYVPSKRKLDVCVHTDASKAHWRAIVTQLAPGELPKERAEQNHLPLAFISFSFRGSMLDGQLLRKKRMQ